MATGRQNDIIQTRDIFTGAVNAPVTLVCYVDYESTACATANVVLNELLAGFPNQLRINIRHFPLAQIHQKAMKAAEAAIAAAQEGLFWPMNNMLFANQKSLGTISLKQYARQIGSTNKRFLDQVINGVYAWQVREDLLEGLDLGIRTVPVVYINGELLEEDITLDSLSRRIQQFI